MLTDEINKEILSLLKQYFIIPTLCDFKAGIIGKRPVNFKM